MNPGGWVQKGPGRLAAAVGAGLLLAAGCGDEPGDRSEAIGPGSVPRLEGRYVVTLEPLDYERGRQRIAWRMTPRCDAGACDTTAKTSRADRIDLSFDEDSGRYVGRATFKADCVSRRTGRLLVEDAYRDRARIAVEPLEAEEGGEGDIVTRFRGRSRRTLDVTRSAREKFRCTIGRDERVETDRLKGVLTE